MSVIVPTRNRRERLAGALRSALWQRDVDLEVLVVDDGSTDGTEEFIRTVEDARVRLFRNPVTKGVGATRNRGIAEARGRWVAFLDDDDLWSPQKLRLQLAALKKTGRRWAYGGEVLIDPGLRVVDGRPPPPPHQVMASLERFNSVPAGASNVVVASQLLAQVGPFDRRLSTTEDWDMWIRLARAEPPAWVPRPLVAASIDHANVARKMARMREELHTIARRHGIRVNWAQHYRWAAWETLCDGRRWTALRYYGLAIAAGDLKSVARAAIALLAPHYPERILHRQIKADVWIAEAQTWLRAFRQ